MAEKVLMPKQGNTVESCIILEWKKQEGDPVEEGEVICEAETDKATIEVESTAGGTVLKLLYAVDDDVPVQQPIAIVGEAGEDISSLLEEAGGAAETAEESDKQPEKEADENKGEKTAAKNTAAKKTEEAQPAASGNSADTGISPRAKNLAADKGVGTSGLAGSGPHGRVIEQDVRKVLSSGEPATPAAREKMAAEGLQTPERGTGIGGRVTAGDLIPGTPATAAAVQKASGSGGAESGGYQLEFPGETAEIPVRSIRKITAERMYESVQSTCQLTLTSSASAEKLLALRKRFKNSGESLGMQGITMNDMILFAAARTLPRFRYVNSHFLGEKIVEFSHVHLGCAVDTPKGLMVPVIPFADLRSLKNLSQEAKQLITAGQEGKLSPEKLEGGTFTITNLGALGVEHFTPVLNVPETAILGVNTIMQRPVQTEDGIALKPYIGLSLTFDHQAFDGAPAARFLKALVQTIEQIDVVIGT